MGKVFVFCEYSDTVSAAFRAEGHDVMSCDLEPSENPDANHYQGDGRHLLRERWDLVIAHPPCTYLTVARGKLRDINKLIDAACFFNECYTANAPMVCVENPLPYRVAMDIIGRYDQIVQPYQFGDAYLKRTCLWLRGLPPLMPTGWMGEDGSLPVRVMSTSSKKAGRVAVDTAEWGNPHLRSRFHPGMAAAMACQWGSLCP